MRLVSPPSPPSSLPPRASLPQAVLVLEAAQQRRKVSAPLRLAATALYSLLGAPSLGEQPGRLTSADVCSMKIRVTDAYAGKLWQHPSDARLRPSCDTAPPSPLECCAASAQFAALDIKSILHDSLTGHWLLPLAAAAGGEDAADLRRWVLLLAVARRRVWMRIFFRATCGLYLGWQRRSAQPACSQPPGLVAAAPTDAAGRRVPC